jgi:hypothetical protein
MSNKTLFEPSCPLTQTAAAVKSLITFHNHGHEPAEMPAFYRLTAEMVLVQSNKKDVYYVVTPKSCSCPSATYRPNQTCKHQRRYFPQPKSQAAREAEVEAELAKERGAKRLARPPVDSIRPTGKWNGHNGPVSDLLEDMKKQGYEMSFEAVD